MYLDGAWTLVVSHRQPIAVPSVFQLTRSLETAWPVFLQLEYTEHSWQGLSIYLESILSILMEIDLCPHLHVYSPAHQSQVPLKVTASNKLANNLAN